MSHNTYEVHLLPFLLALNPWPPWIQQYLISWYHREVWIGWTIPFLLAAVIVLASDFHSFTKGDFLCLYFSSSSSNDLKDSPRVNMWESKTAPPIVLPAHSIRPAINTCNRVGGGIMRKHLLWKTLSFTCLIKPKETYLKLLFFCT